MPSAKSIPLVLASQSPRRRLLLKEGGYQFRVIAPPESSECGICTRETPPEMVARLGWQKARDVACQVEEGMVIGCDTVAECQGQVLGKPHHREHAREMLKLMSGRTHRVYSGLCLWHRPSDWTIVDVAVSHLRMRALSEELLESYLSTDAWEGKAGAFGFQDGLDWIRLEDGSESNVVGLPMELLETLLETWNEKGTSQNQWAK